MADLTIGVQGSGKSYRAVKKIFEDRNNYVQILTNINEIKLDGNISKLNFTQFMNEVIRPIHDKFKLNNNITDSEIQSLYNEKMGIEDGLKLIVVDEAQNFFNKKDEAITWLVTYHRHFNIELMLISQLVTGIHTDNRIFNNVYEALNPSKQFVPNTIRYNHYLGLPANSSNYNGKDNLKIDDNVFTLYGSGGTVKKKNIVLMPILILLFLIALLFFGFHYVLTMFNVETIDKEFDATKSDVLNEPKVTNFKANESPIIVKDYVNKRFTTCVMVKTYNPSYNCRIDKVGQFSESDKDVIFTLLNADIIKVTNSKDMKVVYITYDADRLSLFEDYNDLESKEDVSRETIPDE